MFGLLLLVGITGSRGVLPSVIRVMWLFLLWLLVLLCLLVLWLLPLLVW